MQCAAIPYDEQDARASLEEALEITSYPTLVMLGPKQDDAFTTKGDRVVINSEVRAVIENGDYITDFPFYPKPWGDLCSKLWLTPTKGKNMWCIDTNAYAFIEETTDDINTHKCLIVFQEGTDEELQEEGENAVRMVAEEYRGDELIKFYWANDADSALPTNIRDACRLGVATDTPTMILLDVRNNGTFYVSPDDEITVASIKFFLLNYKELTEQHIWWIDAMRKSPRRVKSPAGKYGKNTVTGGGRPCVNNGCGAFCLPFPPRSFGLHLMIKIDDVKKQAYPN